MSNFYWFLEYPIRTDATDRTQVARIVYQQLHDYAIDYPGVLADLWTLMITTHGHMTIDHGNEIAEGRRGSVSLLMPGEPHRFRATQWEVYTLQGLLVPPLCALLRTRGICRGTTWRQAISEEGLAALQEIFSYPKEAGLAPYRAAVLLESLVLGVIRRQEAHAEQPTVMRLQDIVRYLQMNPATPLTVTDMARMAALSRSRFTYLFQQEVGLSPYAFLTSQRIDRAKVLLETTGLPAAQIGAQVGYPDPHHFYVAFKRLTGMAPGAYRASVIG